MKYKVLVGNLDGWKRFRKGFGSTREFAGCVIKNFEIEAGNMETAKRKFKKHVETNNEDVDYFGMLRMKSTRWAKLYDAVVKEYTVGNVDSLGYFVMIEPSQ